MLTRQDYYGWGAYLDSVRAGPHYDRPSTAAAVSEQRIERVKKSGSVSFALNQSTRERISL
jgi:hypothetical protein